MTPHRIATAVVALSSLLSGCAKEEEMAREPRLQPLSVSLRDLPARPLAPSTLEEADHDAVLHVEMVNGDGEVVLEREAPDPRLVFSEFTSDGEPDPRVGIATHFSLNLDLPNVAGTLQITDSSGATMRSPVSIERLDAHHERTQALGSSADVRGPPVQLFARSENGPDILLLAEGFTEAELPAFDALALQMGQAIRNHPSFAGYSSRIGVMSQRVRSVQSGADDPATGVTVNTAFDASFNVGGTDRCLYFSTDAGRQFAQTLAAAAGAEVVALVVNTSKYGGCANTGAFATAIPVGASSALVQERGLVAVHELGHALFNLGDEYGGTSCQPSRSLPGKANIGSYASRFWYFPASYLLPWSSQIPAGTAIPTPVVGAAPRAIGAFEGAHYCDNHRFRPSPVCGMRAIENTFCPVCQGEVARVFATSYPVLPSCSSFCGYGECGECDEGGYVQSCYVHNGCGGMYNIP